MAQDTTIDDLLAALSSLPQAGAPTGRTAVDNIADAIKLQPNPQPRMADLGGMTGMMGNYRGRPIELTDQELPYRLRQLQAARDYLYGNIDKNNKQAADQQMGMEALANLFATTGGVQKGALPSANNFININNNALQNANKLGYQKVGSEEDTFNVLNQAARLS